MNLALVAFLAYTAVLLAIGIWSYRIVEKVPIAKYEEEFYAAGRGLAGDVKVGVGRREVDVAIDGLLLGELDHPRDAEDDRALPGRP